MYKIFKGFHLVEAYHEFKKAKRLTKNQTVARCIKLAIAIIVALVLWFLPIDSYGIEGLTIIEQRLISIFIFATLMWIFEAIPAWTTSVLIVVLLLLSVSDSSLWLFTENIPTEELGKAVKYKSIMHCFADPIIMLFIGGFILAIAATKSGLDVLLARVMLQPFGTQSRYVLLGFILVTAVFSMFLSNTATAAMMLTFLTPVLKALPADGKGKIGLAMAIPVAANVGGMGTPIGTPPNAIALKYLNDPEGLNLNIGFGEWMSFMLPYTIVVLFIAWFILLRLFPFKQKNIELKIEGKAKKDWRSIVVYITFTITVLLWMFDKFTGVNSNVVAMIPVAVFCVTGIITKRDLEEISWSVLWMVAGGFALGVALQETGLAKHMIEAIPFETWPPVLMIVGSGLICYAMANFISHTATAALLVPILAIAGSSMRENLSSLGGVETLLIGVAIGSSLAMILPISTPPNAIALKYLNDPEGLNLNIGFGEWMSFMLPYTIVVLFIAWFILLRLFPFKQKNIELKIEGKAKKDWRSIVVYITFTITVLLWMFDKFTGVNSNVVAMIPVAVFCVTGIITKRDLEEISWSVLWMVAGGFALGVALQETGLAKHMIEAIPFETWPPVLMIVGSGLICYAMANFISHTATAALLVPILAIAGSSMRENLSSLGGVETLLIGVAIGSSLAMILPISTPPNALAHATGMIEQKDMEKVGIIMGIVGLILGYSMLVILGSNGIL